MKKLSVLAVAVIFTLGLTSCKKDWNCTCTDPGFDPDVYAIPDSKKSDAKKVCDSWSTLYSITGGSCDLEAK